MARDTAGRRGGGLLLLLAGTAGSGVLLQALAAPPLRALAASRPGDPSALATLPLDQLVTAGCAAALTACWLWLAACTWLVTARALRHGATACRVRRVPGCPRLLQVVVLVALGVTVTAPAHAEAGPGGSGPGVAGLALPDRVDAAAPPRPAVRVRVRPGDSLWRVAQRLLPDGAPDTAVDLTWRRIAARNADRIGPDPDLIFPGTLLRVPAPDRALGKDDR